MYLPMGTGIRRGYSHTPSSRATTGGGLSRGSGGSGGGSGTGGAGVPTLPSVIKASD